MILCKHNSFFINYFGVGMNWFLFIFNYLGIGFVFSLVSDVVSISAGVPPNDSHFGHIFGWPVYFLKYLFKK